MARLDPIIIPAEVQRTDVEVVEYFAGINANDPLDVPLGDETVQEHRDRMSQKSVSRTEEARTEATLNELSRRYISEDMLQTITGAMGEHSAPALLYVGTDGKVTRVDWEALPQDDREIEIFLGLLRVAAGRHIDWNAPSTEALRPTGRRSHG